MKSIHFTVDEVSQILCGDKIQCRKIIKYGNKLLHEQAFMYKIENNLLLKYDVMHYIKGDELVCWGSDKLLYKIGEIIYCKEPWISYPEGYMKEKPAINMPAYMSRCKIRITDIRVERLQEISYSDISKSINILQEMRCQNCGELPCFCGNYFPNTKTIFCADWDANNPKNNWESNPWVWVYTFKKV